MTAHARDRRLDPRFYRPRGAPISPRPASWWTLRETWVVVGGTLGGLVIQAYEYFSLSRKQSVMITLSGDYPALQHPGGNEYAVDMRQDDWKEVCEEIAALLKDCPRMTDQCPSCGGWLREDATSCSCDKRD